MRKSIQSSGLRLDHVDAAEGDRKNSYARLSNVLTARRVRPPSRCGVSASVRGHGTVAACSVPTVWEMSLSSCPAGSAHFHIAHAWAVHPRAHRAQAQPTLMSRVARGAGLRQLCAVFARLSTEKRCDGCRSSRAALRTGDDVVLERRRARLMGPRCGKTEVRGLSSFLTT